jgi:hypothetical protein
VKLQKLLQKTLNIYTLLLEEYKKQTILFNPNLLQRKDIPGWIFNNFIYNSSKSLFTKSKVKIFNVSHEIDDNEDFIIGGVVSSIIMNEDNDTHNIKASISDILTMSKEMEFYFQIIGLKKSVNLYTVTQHS